MQDNVLERLLRDNVGWWQIQLVGPDSVSVCRFEFFPDSFTHSIFFLYVYRFNGKIWIIVENY